MGRRIGSRNADHEEKRAALARSVFVAVSASPGRSLREIADAAGVQPNTLRHYFGDRPGAVSAALRSLGAVGERYASELANRAPEAPGPALRWFMGQLVQGWSNGLATAHATGLAEGLRDHQVGAAYIDGVLEPTLQGVETLITRWMAEGKLAEADPRMAALSLVSPVFMALLHQHSLGGGARRKLDLAAFSEVHLTRWLRGWS